jgi:hypothetical protein
MFLSGDQTKKTEGYFEMAEGGYSWPFNFTIPSSAPLSHIDETVEVLYTISAVVDAPEMPIATSQILHHIAVLTRPPNAPRTDSNTLSINKFSQEAKLSLFGLLKKPIIFRATSAVPPKFAFHSMDTLFPINCTFG